MGADIDTGWFADDDGALPLGAAFRPGLDPLPARQHAWAVVKDRLGRPAHDEPRASLHRVTLPVPRPAPDEAIGYVLYAGLTYNTLFAARGVPISVFDLHDRDLHVPGSVSRSEWARSWGAWQRTNWQNDPSGVS